MDSSAIVTILTSITLATAFGETIRWLANRGRSKVDTAKAVQGMALDLLSPLREELARTQTEMASMRTTVTRVQMELEAVIAWALAARAILDQNAIDYPPVPSPLNQHRNL